MYKDLLPVGSVVRLKGGEKRLMVCGRVIAGGEENGIHDYVGCYYPEGIVDSSKLFFFEQDAVDAVYFIGFQDTEEINFKRNVLSKLDEGDVALENGQIVLRQK